MQKLPSRNKSAEHFVKLLDAFLLGAAGTNRGEIQKWLAEDGKLIRRAYSALKKEQEICTIMHPQIPQKLNSFFYVPRVSNRNIENQVVNPIDLITKQNITATLVSGTLGQGKSMFLRYLQFLELNIGNTIPIFLEFQKIKGGNYILDAAKDKLVSLGIDCSSKLFDFLFSKGHISLFLDGYDEIQFEKRPLFDIEINKIINRNDGYKIFITSRYDTEIERLPGITLYKIEPLTEEDHPLFLKKIVREDSEVSTIIRKIVEAREFDPTVLDTPLLLTWFIMVYRNRRKIPRTKIGFYEELFKTILSRHDGIKGSLDRPSKSKLPDDEIELILHAFCYITSKDDESDFDENNIIRYIKKSINIAKIPSVNADNYLYDLTHITCLLVKDGMSYSFIHDSIQSYFSACFIKETTEKNSQKFYEKADINWKKWGDELNFLFHLDSYRFHKLMITPSITGLTKVNYEELAKNEMLPSLNHDTIKKIYSDSFIVFQSSENKDVEYYISFYHPSTSFTCHFIFNGGNYEICTTDKAISTYINAQINQDSEFKKILFDAARKKHDRGERIYLNLLDMLQQGSKVHNFCVSIHDHTLALINYNLRLSFGIIKPEELKGDLFDV